MEDYMWWLIAGIALVIAELVTTTFYLLVLGIAAFAGAAVSYLGYSFWIEAVAAAAVAAVGVVLVSRYRSAQAAAPSSGNVLDVGQSVVMDSWVNEADRMARVRYRNALWDAKVLDPQAVEIGHVLYIRSVDGSTLQVSRAKPA